MVRVVVCACNHVCLVSTHHTHVLGQRVYTYSHIHIHVLIYTHVLTHKCTHTNTHELTHAHTIYSDTTRTYTSALTHKEGLARTVCMHRKLPYIWFDFCQNYLYTLYGSGQLYTQVINTRSTIM
jgi:hypothetical protein